MARLDQLVRFVNFFEFIGRAGAVAFTLGEFDVGVIDMVVQPRFVDFSTLCFNFQTLLSVFFFHCGPLSSVVANIWVIT